jgi:hypothetical protein
MRSVGLTREAVIIFCVGLGMLLAGILLVAWMVANELGAPPGF